MPVPEFTYVEFAGALGGPSAVCARLPNGPGIYAWFREISIVANGSSGAFVDSILKMVTTPAAPIHEGRLGPLHRATLASATTLSKSKLERLERVAEHQDGRQHLATIFNCVPVRPPPSGGPIDIL
jgi:hypothetical protein